MYTLTAEQVETLVVELQYLRVCEELTDRGEALYLILDEINHTNRTQ